MLEVYLQRFQSRLAPSNVTHLNTLIRVCQQLLHYCKTAATSEQAHPRTHSVNQFLFDCGLDDVNFITTVRWMRESRLPFKANRHHPVHHLTRCSVGLESQERARGRRNGTHRIHPCPLIFPGCLTKRR